MDDLNQSEALTEQMKVSDTTTQDQTRAFPDIAADKDEAAFRAGQNKVLEMITRNAPSARSSPAWCC